MALGECKALFVGLYLSACSDFSGPSAKDMFLSCQSSWKAAALLSACSLGVQAGAFLFKAEYHQQLSCSPPCVAAGLTSAKSLSAIPHVSLAHCF